VARAGGLPVRMSPGMTTARARFTVPVRSPVAARCHRGCWQPCAPGGCPATAGRTRNGLAARWTTGRVGVVKPAATACRTRQAVAAELWLSDDRPRIDAAGIRR